MRPGHPALLLGFLLAGCVAQPSPQPPPGPPCVRVALAGEQLHVGWHSRPCSVPGIDSLMTWSIVSEHRRCDAIITIDRAREQVGVVWLNCRAPGQRTGR